MEAQRPAADEKKQCLPTKQANDLVEARSLSGIDTKGYLRLSETGETQGVHDVDGSAGGGSVYSHSYHFTFSSLVLALASADPRMLCIRALLWLTLPSSYAKSKSHASKTWLASAGTSKR